MIIKPKVARWAVPLLKPVRYKGVKGGRSGGKSHQLCEISGERMAANPNYKVAGIREIQKSIKYSLKSLLEKKLHELGASYLFDIKDQEIKRRGGEGVAVFLGMQDHTADSVKGLEDFDLGLVDEANGLSHTSVKKLTPTFRKQGSELMFAWNPEEETDAIDEFFAENEGHPDFLLLHVNITDNPWASDTALAEYEREKARAERLKDTDPNAWQRFQHVWHGHYNTLSEKYVFRNWRIDTLTPPEHVVWFYGTDWGFSVDPTAGLRCCVIGERTLYIDSEIYEVGCPNERLPVLLSGLPQAKDWPNTADSARPETIDYVRRHGFPKMRAAKKGKGSVEDGVMFLQGMDIVVHPLCANTINELRNYAYKTDKHTGEILPVIEDANNHLMDALRYAVEGLHRKGKMLPTILDTPRKRDRYERHEEDEDEVSWRVA